MGSNPINLAVRFLLEICALLSLGLWGWQRSDGLLRFLLAIGLPLIAAVVWGVFAVPGDPSRSGEAPVPVPGMVRLGLELALFACAVWALSSAGYIGLSRALGVVTVLHYAVSYDRLWWLVKQ